MSQPGSYETHQPSVLTNISVGLGRQAFIADRLFPRVPVTRQTDLFYKLLKGAFFRLEAGVRGPGADARRSGYHWTTGQYNCHEEALATDVPIEDIQNADDPLRPLEDGEAFCENAVLLTLEKMVSDTVTTAGNWTTSEDVEGGWAPTDSTNTFVGDVLGAKKTVLELTGFEPNVLEISYNTFNKLKQSATILDRIKYTGTQGKPADVTPAMLAALLELEEVVIGKAIYSDAEEVQAGTDFNAVRMFETNAGKGGAFLFFRPAEPGIKIPSAGYVFDWPNAVPEEGVEVMLRGSTTIRRWYEKSGRKYVVEASQRFDPKVVAADAGYCFYDTILT